MIRKNYYLALGGADERLGHYGHTGAEFTLKVWLNDDPALVGRLVVRRDVICGHVFGTNTDGQLYEVKTALSKNFYGWALTYYGDKIPALVEKFAPVPTWDDEALATRRLVTIIRPVDNAAPAGVMDYCFDQLKLSAPNNMIVVAEKPDDRPRSLASLISQLLEAAESARSKNVYVAEQDVLYHPDRFDFVPPADDVFYYQREIWRFNRNGFFKWPGNNGTLSTLICNRQLLIKALTERLAAIKDGWSPPWSEPGKGDPETQFKIDFYDAPPAVDIRHGENFTGDRTPPNGVYYQQVDYWGKAEDLLEKLHLS
jgi:hypothetical protein